MVIETNLHRGEGIVRGDQFSFRRIVRGVPAGLTLSGAKLTLKSSIADTDPGLFQKSITTSNVTGTGYIEDAGSSGVGKLRFDLTSTDTLLMEADVQYYFDIQITLTNDDTLTLERGQTSASTQVTTS